MVRIAPSNASAALRASQLRTPGRRQRLTRDAPPPTRVHTQFPLKHAEKDMRLAVGMGAAHGIELPVASTADRVMVAAMGAGHGDLDFSAVAEVQKKPK